MGITLSPREYATAFRLLASTARHPENIARLVEERLSARMSQAPSLLDVGAGSGKVAQALATRFGSLTLLEPNPEQVAQLRLEKAKVLIEPFERFDSSERFDLVLCSHVLYHVPPSDWPGFIDRLLSFVRPGGHALIIMAAGRGPTFELCRDFADTLNFGQLLLDTLGRMSLSHEVLPAMSGFTARTFEEMFTLCRFFVLEGCFTAEQLAAMGPEASREMDRKLRQHAEACLRPDGTYQLEQDEDMVLIPRP
ncbi:bifunctional 2-polyprenyl-6-hydroxyphenol methylase/3-demethylubiquinol 3-O-methyltransferase UbiG [Myxococcus sp. AB025B]|uniref:class I SAM-dependent methyltransferase n=1 Tax=Myxococcus sp. AB025B TaxID=2562794 RepID=UPI00114485D8|nr:class I SAM-dependent methyltransferase [Myxococcus sp. AB025B]